MSRDRDPFPVQGRILSRFSGPDDFERKLARILLDTGEAAPAKAAVGATAPGDARRLRGIPAIGRSVAGAIPGTSPHGTVL